MIDFRDYKYLIREKVKQINENDPNWKWSVKTISSKKVSIRWGYLDYLEEENNCFYMHLEVNADAGNWIWAKRPDGEFIECYMVAEQPNPRIGAEMSVKGGILSALEEIAYHAGSRY